MNTNEWSSDATITIVKTTLPDRIKATRQKLGWSQARLASEAGVSQSTIGNIESGFRQRPRELVSIAQALGVSPEWLETGRTQNKLLELVQQGSAADVASVRGAVEFLAAFAAQQRPTLRKNLGNLLVELLEHPDDPSVVEQTVADIERFFKE